MIFAQKITGIDINPNKIRIAEIQKKYTKLELIALDEISLSEGIFYDGEIKNEEALREALKKIVGNKNNFIVSSLPEEKTFIKNFEISKNDFNLLEANKNEIPEIIKKNVKEHIPVPIEEVYVDWQVVENNKNKESWKILVGAVFSNTADNLIDFYKNTGLTTLALELKSQAIIRNINFEDEKSAKIIVHLGDSSSMIILGEKNNIYFTLSTPLSGEKTIEIIEQKLKLKKAEAKKARKVCGLTNKNCKNIVKKIVEPELKDLISSIKKAIEFYKNENQEKNTPEIIICGEGSELHGIDIFINEKTGIPCSILDLKINLSKKLTNLSPKLLSYTIPIGLAIGGKNQL